MTDLTKDEIVKMARECNLMDGLIPVQSQLERFASLCRADLVAEVERLNADMKQMGADLCVIQEIHNQQKAKLYAELADWKARALKAEQVGPAAIDITLDEDDALSYLRDMVVQDNGDLTPIRLLVGGGHSGYGLYIASADYPEEGAILLHQMKEPPHPAAQEPTSAVPVVEQLVGALELVNKSDDDCDFMNTEAAARVGDAIAAGQKFIKENKHA